jgi:Tol biopolymer transport system component
MTRLYLRIAPCILIALMACTTPPRRTGDYKIALVSIGTGQQGIFVMNSDGTEKKLVFKDTNAQLFPASWSPDGKKIALFLARKKEDADIIAKYQIPYHYPLYELDVASGKERRLLAIPVSAFRWSPDGRSMLYLSSYEDDEQVKSKSAIYILNLQTGEQKRLTDLAKNCYVAFSPDGTQLVYSLGTEQSSDIYTVGLDGKNPQRLTDSKSVNSRPVWSPDGKSIAYISANPPGAPNNSAGVYIMDPTGANKTLVSSMAAFRITWSPDGKSLLIQQWEGGASLMDADGNNIRNITTEWGPPLDAVFAPDGKKLVLRPKNNKLYSADLDGTHVRTIADMITSSFSLSKP